MGNEIELIDEFVEDDVTLNRLETEINILDEDSELEIELDKANGFELQIDDDDNPSGIELDNTYFKIAEDRINKTKESIFDL